MKTRRKSKLSVLALATTIMCTGSVAEANKLLSVNSSPLSSAGRLVTIATAEQPTFTVFRLYDPMRVVIDVSGGDTSNFKGPVSVDDGIVGDVGFHQFRAGDRVIGRVTVNVLKDMRYEVRANGNAIELKLREEGKEGAAAGTLQPPAPPAMDRRALEQAKAAQLEAQNAAAAAQKERQEALRLQKELTARQEALGQQQSQLEAERQSARQAAAEATRLQEKLNVAVAAEKRAIKAELDKANAQKREAEAAAAKLASERVKMEKTVAELKAQQEKSAAAAQEAEQAARQKLSEAESVLASANKTKTELADKLAAAAQERGELQKRKAELDEQRQLVAAQLKEQQELATVLANQRKELESDIASYQEANSQLSSKLAKAEAEKEALSDEVAALKKSLAEKENTVADKYGPATMRRVAMSRDGKLVMSFNGQLPKYEVQTLSNPSRIVIDMADTDRVPALPLTHKMAGRNISKVRLGEHPGHLRVVLDVAAASNAYSITEEGHDLVVSFDNSVKQSAFADSGRVSKVNFGRNAGYSVINIATSDRLEYSVDDTPDHAYVLTIKGAVIDSSAERAMDTSSFKSGIQMVSAYQESRNPAVVKVLVNVQEKSPYTISYHGNQLVWEIADAQGHGTMGNSRGTMLSTPGATGSYTAQANTMAQSTVGAASAQKRITIDLKDADVVNVIRLIAEVSGENIITSDNVQGKITLKLRNVPWEQALDLILATKGYGKVRTNNIIRIAPAQELQKEKEMELNRRKADQMIADPVKKIVLVNYAKASELKAQLVPMLSERGSIQESERKNALIINELPDKIDDILLLAKALDTPTAQVHIAARIVEASSNYLRQLGIQWGGNATRSPTYGNATGLSFPNTLMFTGAADDESGNQTAGVMTPSNYAVNLPAAVGSGSGGGIGITFGNVSGSALLSIRLSALEESGSARLISAPSISTLDNKKATIRQGIDIPISVTSAAGVNTQFVSASLELEVLPHVTNDGSVMMAIKVSKDEPDFSRTGASGDPTIQKKTAETEVLVPDGDTTVIGGIYTRSTSKTTSKVPFLSKIPILGYLFRNTRESDDRAELLIFITPTIQNRDAALNGGNDFNMAQKEKAGDNNEN